METLAAVGLSSCAGGLQTEVATSKASNSNCYWDPDVQACICVGSPVLIDMDGDGYDLTSPRGGVMFALVNGHMARWAWTEPGSDDAFLALDLNFNNVIDNGSELFGDNSLQATSEDDRHGFMALAAHDLPVLGGNSDGRITALDSVFPRLRLWRDVNHDGISQPVELVDLSRAGVREIGLQFATHSDVDEHGNQFRYSAPVIADAPVAAVAFDVFLLRDVITTGGDTGGVGTQDINSNLGWYEISVVRRDFMVLRSSILLPGYLGPYQPCYNGYTQPWFHPVYGNDRAVVYCSATTDSDGLTGIYPEIDTDQELYDRVLSNATGSAHAECVRLANSPAPNGQCALPPDQSDVTTTVTTVTYIPPWSPGC